MFCLTSFRFLFEFVGCVVLCYFCAFLLTNKKGIRYHLITKFHFDWTSGSYYLSDQIISWLFDVYIERYRCFFLEDEIIPSCMDYVNFKSHRKDPDMNQLTECFPNTFWIRSDTLEVPKDGSLSFRIRKITSSKPPLDLYSSLLSLALILEDPKKILSKIEGFAPFTSKTYFWVDVYMRVEQKVHERGFLCVSLWVCN